MVLISEELYRKWQPMKASRILLGALVQAKERDMQESILNRLKDYWHCRRFLNLHYDFQKILEEEQNSYSSWKYGQSYFYQSCKPCSIRGLRNTEARIASMGLQSLVKGARVLDIGCNVGFLDLELAPFAQSITAFDINPWCIKIAQRAADQLNIKNVHFICKTFEDFHEEKLYDVVLSFANHHTYDQNTTQSLEEYFSKISTCLRSGGVCCFESHAPVYETPEQLSRAIKLISKFFDIKKQSVLKKGNKGDKGRTFCLCVKK